MVEATLKLEYWQLVHFDGQAATIMSCLWTPQKTGVLTITLVLVVIGNQGRPITHPVAIRPDACVVQHVLPCTADDTLAGRRAGAGLAER